MFIIIVVQSLVREKCEVRVEDEMIERLNHSLEFVVGQETGKI